MEINHTSNLNEAIDFIKLHSERHPTQEVCGFLGFDEDQEKFAVTIEDNIANDPENTFAISPVRFLKFKNEYKIAAVWHSHVCGPEDPSDFDKIMAKGCLIPFLIYSCQTKLTGLYKPEGSMHEFEI